MGDALEDRIKKNGKQKEDVKITDYRWSPEVLQILCNNYRRCKTHGHLRSIADVLHVLSSRARNPGGKDLRVEFDEPKAGDPMWPYFEPIRRFPKMPKILRQAFDG